MLTSNMVRVRYKKNQIVPCYLDEQDAQWQLAAESMLEIYRDHLRSTRGELEDEIKEVFGNSPAPQIYQGLAKLLEDRCEFSVDSKMPPDQLRALVFDAAVAQRRQIVLPESSDGKHAEKNEPRPLPKFSREQVIQQVANELKAEPDEIERGLFADLKSEQQIVAFKDLSPERLIQRYNIALAQAVLMRADAIEVTIRHEPPKRYRQLLKRLKFHRLMCQIEAVSEKTIRLKLDGPLSLFGSTQKYGFQLAMFLPAILLCKNFELHADLKWGPKRVPKKFELSANDGLVSHYTDTGMYTPPELAMFAESFRKKAKEWEIIEETEIFPLGDSFWVPDFALNHKESGQVVYLEVLGFWRRSSVDAHLRRLKKHATEPFVLAVSDQLHADEEDLNELPGVVYRFRQMPLVGEVERAANEVIKAT